MTFKIDNAGSWPGFRQQLSYDITLSLNSDSDLLIQLIYIDSRIPGWVDWPGGKIVCWGGEQICTCPWIHWPSFPGRAPEGSHITVVFYFDIVFWNFVYR